MRNNQPVTNVEIQLDEHSLIVSKTDLKGRITYINRDFLEISGFTEAELIGEPHNLVRHPDMPVEAFHDLWGTLKQNRPWTGYVKNRCKNGDYYWVEANATPIWENGQVTGYMSVRRKAEPAVIQQVDVVTGNSSSTVLEAPIFKVPTVLVGNRQEGRPMGASTINVGADRNQILAALQRALSPEFKAIAAAAEAPFGTAGFAAGGPDRHLARAFLQGMTELVGAEKTAVWGTEQVASNFLVANDTAPVVLPYGRYLNYWGEPWGHDAAFIHFVGTHRHAGGAYVDASRRVIDGLHQS